MEGCSSSTRPLPTPPYIAPPYFPFKAGFLIVLSCKFDRLPIVECEPLAECEPLSVVSSILVASGRKDVFRSVRVGVDGGGMGWDGVGWRMRGLR